MPVTRHPPYRSVHEELPHTAPTSGNNAEISGLEKGVLFCVHHQDRSTQHPAPVCGLRQCSWCSPWPTPFPPPAPQRFSPHCSPVSQVLCCCPTSVAAHIGFKIINLDCVIGRRSITIRLPPSSLAKLIILKPIPIVQNFSFTGRSSLLYSRKTHGSPDSRVKDVHTCQVLRLRRAVLQLAW